MQLKDLIPNSTLAIIATFKGEESIEKAELFVDMNRYVIQQFDKVRIIYNSTEDAPMHLIKKFSDVYTNAFPGTKCLYRLHNDGHMFGTMDLDELCLWYAKEDGSKYLWKSTEDVVMDTNILNVEVPNSTDFAYLPGFSYETICLAPRVNTLLEDYEKYFFTPQSNFFIITTAVESLYGSDVSDKRKIYESLLLQKPTLKPWEVNFPDCVKFDCESHLGRTTKYLNNKCLLSDKAFRSLANHINIHKEGDPSHKNIYLKEVGICHFHNYKDPVYYV